MTAPRLLGGRYEVGELIGRGGMAEVHLGHDTRLDRDVAIKLLRSDLARDANFLTRFRREAQAAGGLSHPEIVAIYDSGEETSTESGGATVPLPYIVMEYVDGETLRAKVMREHVVAPAEAATIVEGVLSALAYSHRMGIVHRDIKPANVMITRTGDVKVMDFGIARAVADTSATMTQTQAVIGTAQYLSPEQAQGLQVDARSDLYSTGCLLFELLTGRPPFLGESPVSVAYQHVGEPPQPPSSFNHDVPAGLRRHHAPRPGQGPRAALPERDGVPERPRGGSRGAGDLRRGGGDGRSRRRGGRRRGRARRRRVDPDARAAPVPSWCPSTVPTPETRTTRVTPSRRSGAGPAGSMPSSPSPCSRCWPAAVWGGLALFSRQAPAAQQVAVPRLTGLTEAAARAALAAKQLTATVQNKAEQHGRQGPGHGPEPGREHPGHARVVGRARRVDGPRRRGDPQRRRAGAGGRDDHAAAGGVQRGHHPAGRRPRAAGGQGRQHRPAGDDGDVVLDHRSRCGSRPARCPCPTCARRTTRSPRTPCRRRA